MAKFAPTPAYTLQPGFGYSWNAGNYFARVGSEPVPFELDALVKPRNAANVYGWVTHEGKRLRVETPKAGIHLKESESYVPSGEA